MKNLRFSYTCELSFSAPVTSHSFTLRITPHDDDAQTVAIENCRVEPLDECTSQTDGWGNLLYVGSCAQPHDSFVYQVQGTARVDSAKGRGTDENLIYRYPSALTQPGPAIKRLYAGCTSEEANTFMRARALCSAVHGAMAYEPDSTDMNTTAEQAAATGRGVCQDYAHILAALLRLDGISARYVSGLMWGEGATHAWVEFFDGQTWWALDPTNDCEAGDYYIALARGRDASDCPIENGVFRGAASQQQRVNVSVEVIEGKEEASC